MFRDRFWWSLVLSTPVVVYSPMVQHLLRFHTPALPGSELIRRCWARPCSSTEASCS